GNAGTWFWSNRAPVAGDYVGVDLGAVRPIAAVRVAMANGSRPNDYLHNAVLEYSPDAATWTSLGRFAGLADVRANVAGVANARYVRLRSTGSQPNWLVVNEFTVTLRPSTTPMTDLPTYRTYAPGNLIDGDTTSWFWSNGAPAIGAHVGVDLGAA